MYDRFASDNMNKKITSQIIKSSLCVASPTCIVANCSWSCAYCVIVLCVLLYYVVVAVLYTLVAGLLARSQYPEGPATGQLGTVFLGFPVSIS